MQKKMTDLDQPIGELRRVKDFLPPPHELAMPQATVKVTLSLTKTSLEFFKREARKNHTKYQKMIRDLIDRYAHQF